VPPAEPTTAPAEPTTAPADEPTDEPADEPTDEPAAEPTDEPVAATMPYRIAILSDMTSMNVWALYDPDASTWNYTVQTLYWPTLFGLSDQRFDFIPFIAADFATPLEQEGDFWVSTVPIKEGVLWTDGTEVTAEDVAFTAEIALGFDLSGNWLAYDSDYLDHVEAIDPYSAKFVYHTKPGLARHEFGSLQGPIVNKAFWEPKLGDALAKLEEANALDPEGEEYPVVLGEAQEILFSLDPTGEPTAGPFIFSKWEVGAFVENSANSDYWQKGAIAEEYANGAYREYKEGVYDFAAYGDPTGDIDLSLEYGPHFPATIFTIYSQDAAILALQNGDVDFAQNPNGWGMGLQAQLGGDPNITTVTNANNGFRYLTFNMDRPPLDDIALRQAVNCMIDKEFLTQNLMQGLAIPVFTPVPEGNAFWFNPNVTRFCEGLTAQERLEWSVNRLREAGYTWEVEPSWNEERGGSVEWGEGLTLPDGTPFPEMELLAPSPGYDPLRATAGVYIEQWMNQLGMPVKAELTNFNNILTAWFDEDDYDMFILGFGLTIYPDYVCDFYYPGTSWNNAKYNNEEFAALCDEFYASDNLDEARAMNFELQDMLANDLPHIFLFTTPYVDVYRNDTIQFPFTELLGGLGAGQQTIVKSTE
jgi:ABC-type transport system substrate-binding protein